MARKPISSESTEGDEQDREEPRARVDATGEVVTYGRVVEVIESMIADLKRGPRRIGEREYVSSYRTRVESYYKTKQELALYAIRCLKQHDKPRAQRYEQQLEGIEIL
jgi:hypothetical protein